MAEQSVLVAQYSSEEAGVAFMSSFAHVLKNQDEKAAEEILAFTLNIVGASNLYARFAPDTLPRLHESVFSSETIRDFLLSLQSVFIGRWVQGRGRDVVKALVDDLALGISFDLGLNAISSPSSDEDLSAYNSLPEQLGDTLTGFDDAVKIVRANPWLISVLLIHLYINLESFDDLSKPKKRA